MKNINMIILTGSFPYSNRNEDTFLSNEINIFKNKLKKIIIIIFKKKGFKYPISNEIEVELGLSKK